MFTKRHEEQLAEIKALTNELGQRFDQVLGELEGIKKAQEELVKTATRTADAPKPKVVGERTPNRKAGAKKGRGRQPLSPAVGGGPKAAKRRRTSPAEAGDTQEPGRSRKDGKRARKQRQPEPATAAGSGDE